MAKPLDEWLADKLVPDDLSAVYEANETLQALASVSAKPIGPLMRALVNAVAVMGDDLVERALHLMAARPPRATLPKPPTPPEVSHYFAALLGHPEVCRGTPVAASKMLHGGFKLYANGQDVDTLDPTTLDYSEPVKVKGFLAPAVEGAAATIRRELEKAGIPVWSATGGPAEPVKLAKCDGCGDTDRPLRHLSVTGSYAVWLCSVCRDNGALERFKDEAHAENAYAPPGEWHKVEYTPPTVFCERDGCFQDHVKDGRYCLMHTIAVNIAAHEAFKATASEPEATVTEAVTDEVAAAFAAGDIVKAQGLILAGLDNIGEQEAVHVPPAARSWVMPMPRARNLPSFSFDPVPSKPATPRAPTGKPCRVCMRDAYHVHSSPTGKPWHYCDDHEPED